MNRAEEYEKLFERLKKIKNECLVQYYAGLVGIRVTNELLAEKIGVGVMSIYRGFRGEYKEPNLSTLKLLGIFIKEYNQAKKSGKKLQVFLES